MAERSRKRLRGLLLIPIFGGVFWVTALIASTIPGLLVLGVNVHGLRTASYAGDPAVALAPLSQQIITDVSKDSGTVFSSPPTRPVVTDPRAERATPIATPTLGPTPVASPPTPSPVASPTPSPTSGPLPLPSLLPTPTILPTPTPTPTATPVPARAAIKGQVIDAVTHLGIAAANVAISSGGSTTTDVNGNFGIAVNAGSYTLTASATGYNTDSTTVSVNGGQTATVTIKLVSLIATGSIKGTVTNGTSGTPLAGAVITLSNGMSVATDLTGGFEFPAVLYGTYTLTVAAPLYITQSVSVTVRAGHMTTVSIALMHG